MTEQEIRALVVAIVAELGHKSEGTCNCGYELATKKELKKRRKAEKHDEALARARRESPDGKLPYTYW